MLIAFVTYLISLLSQNLPAWQIDFINAFGVSESPGLRLERAALQIGPQLKDGVSKLELPAKSAAAYEPKDKLFLFEQSASEPRPIASITKLMNALVALDHKPDWEASYELKDEDRRDGGKIYLYRGDKVKVRDLWQAMLVGSDNTASIALIHAIGMDEASFVAEMNAKAKYLGLPSTSFADPVGLNSNNLSTAKEIAIFAQAALSQPEISRTVAMSKTEFRTEGGQLKTILSTDALLSSKGTDSLKVLGGKTGYTDLAGYCFVGRFQDIYGNEVIAVVLGTNNETERFRQASQLASWTFDNYKW